MKIQPTFDDLVLGTFGRAFWVIDDISPLRTYAQEQYTKAAFKMISATDGYLSNFRSYQGIRFIGQAEFVGANKGTSVGLNLWIPPTEDKKETPKTVEQPKKKKSKRFKRAKKAAENKVVDTVKGMVAKDKKGDKSKKGKKDKKDKVFFYVLDTQGDTVRTYSRKIKEKGLVRMNWNMRTDGIRMPSRRAPKPEADSPSGLAALPGTYKIVAKYGTLKDSTMVES